jgi:hypothetical protein
MVSGRMRARKRGKKGSVSFYKRDRALASEFPNFGYPGGNFLPLKDFQILSRFIQNHPSKCHKTFEHKFDMFMEVLKPSVASLTSYKEIVFAYALCTIVVHNLHLG